MPKDFKIYIIGAFSKKVEVIKFDMSRVRMT